MALYTGADFSLRATRDLSSDFRDWVATTRRHSQNRLLRALETAYQNAAISPDVRRQVAEAALQFDPLNESACRSVMQLAAAAGEVGVALRAYAALYDAVGLQLDMEPSDATQALVAEIKLGRMTAPYCGSAARTPEHLGFGAGGAAWWCANRSGTPFAPGRLPRNDGLDS